jgi:mono/diheme cytochrome c family protein
MSHIRAISLPALVLASTLLAQPLHAQDRKGSGSEPAIVYSEEQAVRGQTLYYEHCLDCHGETLTGLDQAPPLAGPQFSGIWDGEPLWALVDRIDAMPPTDPGRLTVADNVAILAYMLWYNGLPIGDEPLTDERSVLAAMPFRTPLPGQ